MLKFSDRCRHKYGTGVKPYKISNYKFGYKLGNLPDETEITIDNVKFELDSVMGNVNTTTHHKVTVGWLKKLMRNQLTKEEIMAVGNPQLVDGVMYPISITFRPCKFKQRSGFNTCNPAMKELLSTYRWQRYNKEYCLLKTGDESTIWHHIESYTKKRHHEATLREYCEAFAMSVYSDVGVNVPYGLDLDPNAINSIRLTRKSHPGYYWRHVHGFRRKEQVAAKAFKTAVKTVNSMLTQARHSDHVYALLGRKKPFVRDIEVSAKNKKLKSRMIMCVDTIDTIIGAMVSQPYGKMMKDLNYDTDYKANSNEFFMAYKKWESWHDKEYVVDMDMSDFDSSQQPIVQAVAAAVVETSYKYSSLRKNYFNYVFDNICRKRIAAPDNLIYELVGGLPSGHPWTTLMNTLCNIIMQRACLKKFGMCTTAKLACCGDDTLITFDEKASRHKYTRLRTIKTIIKYCKTFERYTGCDIKEFSINAFCSENGDDGTVFNRNIFMKDGLPTRRISDIARILACPEGGNSGASLSRVAGNYLMLPIFGSQALDFVNEFIDLLGWYRDEGTIHPNTVGNRSPTIRKTDKYYEFQWSQKYEDREFYDKMKWRLTFNMDYELFDNSPEDNLQDLFIIIMRAMEGRSGKYANIYDASGQVATFNGWSQVINRNQKDTATLKLQNMGYKIKNIYKYITENIIYFMGGHHSTNLYAAKQRNALYFNKYNILRPNGAIENVCYPKWT